MVPKRERRRTEAAGQQIDAIHLYNVTREPAQKPSAERLVYEIQRPADFQSSATKVGLQTIRVSNLGDAPASGVRAIVDYPAGVDIVDKVVSMSSGPVGGHTVMAPTPQRLEVLVPNLTAGESVTFSILLSQTPSASARVAVKSDKTVGGSLGDLVAREPESRNAVRDTLGRLLLFLFVLQLPLALYFSRRFRRLLLPRLQYEKSLNNTAFILLHQGLVADASRLLRRAIAAGSADAHVFSNQAVCQALGGDLGGADRSLAAAEFFDRTGKADFVLSFNRALIALVRKDAPEARKHLLAALAHEAPEVRRWCRFSRVFRECAADVQEVTALLAAPNEPDNNQMQRTGPGETAPRR